MKMKHLVFVVFFIVSFRHRGSSQGFVNLDFEESIPTNTQSLGIGLVGQAIVPGWMPFLNGVPQTFFRLNAISSNGGAVLTGPPNSPPIQGEYFMLLVGGGFYPNTAGIGQTGTIPVSAQSMIFWGNVGTNDVSFNGQTLPLIEIGSTQNYNIYGIDMSAFAGQTGQLLFTVAPGSQDAIDNIQFSSASVPEPRTLALGALAILLLCHRISRRNGDIAFFR